MARTPAPVRGRRPIIESSDDEPTTPIVTRSTRRLAGGGARGAPPPFIRQRAVANRRGGPAATAAEGEIIRIGSAARRSRGNGAAAGITRRNGRAAAPIFGGRLNQDRYLGIIGRVLADAEHRGREYRIRRLSENGDVGNMNNPIVLDDSIVEDEDDEEEGDDLDSFLDDDEDHLNAYDLEDSFINDDSLMFGESFDEGDDDDDHLHSMDEENTNPADETFGREIEEFELMEERENAASRRAEERLRKKEDQEEKKNKNLLRTEMFGACNMCAEDEVVDPVGCIFCAGFLGCRKCANRWYRERKKCNNKIADCPMCRHDWEGPVPGVDDMLNLVKSE